MERLLLDHAAPLLGTGSLQLVFLINAKKKIIIKIKIFFDTDFEVIFYSAGTGESGLWVATDILTSQLRQTGSVDVYDVVYQLRQQRSNLVHFIVSKVTLSKFYAE